MQPLLLHGGSKLPPYVRLVAAPDEGYVFSGWSSTAGSFSDTSSPITTFTMPAGNVEVTAAFTKGGGVPATSLRIAAANGMPAAAMISVSRNSTVQFHALLSEGASSAGVVWSISNANLATVSQGGLVTIRNMSGTVVLTARDTASGLVHSITLRIS